MQHRQILSNPLIISTIKKYHRGDDVPKLSGSILGDFSRQKINFCLFQVLSNQYPIKKHDLDLGRILSLVGIKAGTETTQMAAIVYG